MLIEWSMEQQNVAPRHAGDCDMKTRFARILKQLKKRYRNEEDVALVRRAYQRAAAAHRGQVRISKEPYVTHSLEVGITLASVGLDPVTVAAGLLHDVLEDTEVTREQLTDEFGGEIVSLVDAVTKISTISRAEKDVPLEIEQAQNIRKMLVATAQDIRVILIKLADRLHNMRTIDVLSETRRITNAHETLNIYAPLADRLGISTWKWELEDLAFRQLHPEKYREIEALVALKRREREARLAKVLALLSERMESEGLRVRVSGRPKHFYSIYQKMERQGKTFDEVMDIEGVRIVTEDRDACYKAMGIVHDMWPPIMGKFKDYIAVPKYNMYRAIHTTVMRENGTPLEIQIRSEEMDQTAREGIAAHWIYKEGERARDEELDRQLTWLRKMFGWLKDDAAPEEVMESVTREFSPSHIYAFTPKGEVRELPRGATPLDFAYNIHSEIGHHCIGARINGRIVPLTYNLRTGELVEILTSKNKNPSRDWLDIVVTGKARARIRQRLREIGEMEPVEPPRMEKDAAKSSASPPRPAPYPAVPARAVPQVDAATRRKMIRIDGARNMMVQFAKCCDPMPGEPLAAYIVLKGPGITVHRADCKVFLKSPRDPSRVLAASWAGEDAIERAVRVIVTQRLNVLADVMDALRPLNVEIVKASFNPHKNGKFRLDFAFQAPDEDTAKRVIRTLESVPGVLETARLRLDNVEVSPVVRAG